MSKVPALTNKNAQGGPQIGTGTFAGRHSALAAECCWVFKHPNNPDTEWWIYHPALFQVPGEAHQVVKLLLSWHGNIHANDSQFLEWAMVRSGLHDVTLYRHAIDSEVIPSEGRSKQSRARGGGRSRKLPSSRRNSSARGRR